MIEPLFEASFRPGSFGFRPERGARQAIEEIRTWVDFGYDQVIDLDLKSYFDTIDHELLVKLVSAGSKTAHPPVHERRLPDSPLGAGPGEERAHPPRERVTEARR